MIFEFVDFDSSGERMSESSGRRIACFAADLGVTVEAVELVALMREQVDARAPVAICP